MKNTFDNKESIYNLSLMFFDTEQVADKSKPKSVNMLAIPQIDNRISKTPKSDKPNALDIIGQESNGKT